MKNRSWLILGGLLVVAAVLVIGVMPGGRLHSDFEDHKVWDAAQTLIMANGYDCPAVVMVRKGGMSERGAWAEVLCGPYGSDGTTFYKRQHYAVYAESGSVRVCEPFSEFSDTCED